jgi:hypothetical protein
MRSSAAKIRRPMSPNMIYRPQLTSVLSTQIGSAVLSQRRRHRTGPVARCCSRWA